MYVRVCVCLSVLHFFCNIYSFIRHTLSFHLYLLPEVNAGATCCRCSLAARWLSFSGRLRCLSPCPQCEPVGHTSCLSVSGSFCCPFTCKWRVCCSTLPLTCSGCAVTCLDLRQRHSTFYWTSPSSLVGDTSTEGLAGIFTITAQQQ